ncbi:hypothetical protein BKA67DRAFT_653334 [Truncatella angustata]|uniref:Tr-type G domain-containing protein n=1 Tax=Truncatella angustata TaxID=152316 RepID=A0A9P8UXD0_9PEZI|nr:uncharacterized protein BKA67DRAFT_653334 [Truncatella angustata]KAH6660133.1 hypothetical protein BKA67DRAFT_653334 [Truncatella angustata]KAH8202603.1 hypothetical protein TruAng_003204 [Truncatella angustata]
MASVFTFDPNPPRVSSPWLAAEDPDKKHAAERSASASNDDDSEQSPGLNVERLDAEPQDGPIEYKLHLLLRPRRRYDAMTTTSRGVGSQQSRPRPVISSKSGSNTPTSSAQTRQNRLAQLTTQLLWRLQQSSPNHAKARGDLIIPRLPEDSDSLDLSLLEKPEKLLPGLEESNGALYEIGVSDDGTFVGLTKDEMDESMTTLKIMAASLGCRVEVQRMKLVGHCQWTEYANTTAIPIQNRCEADLWVAEALVTPNLEPLNDTDGDSGGASRQQDFMNAVTVSRTEQLRVSLTGPTTSGKTSLLGTLANGSLDNGRGSSRINLLKHRHEVVSGQTSSVAQELIGYKDQKIYNYAGADVDSWTDIHDHAEDGRLVFFSDSAGHLRYRRTILRGVVGWAPHWIFLCITANGNDSPSRGSHSLSGTTDDLADMSGGLDLAVAHLDLCLQLEIPLVILITKYDLATKDKLRGTLNTILTKIKAKGRTPKLLAPMPADGPELVEIPKSSQQKVNQDITRAIAEAGELLSIVPIVLTSAVTGQGIGTIHALLNSLPMPPAPTARDFAPQVLNPEQPAALFHVDDKYELANHASDKSAIVVAGYLRFGTVHIGDKVVLGPFPADEDEARRLIPRDHPSPGDGLSISHSSFSELARFASKNAVSASSVKGEWRNATVVNIRNLRLPVRTMEAGQAGTLQIVFDEPVEEPSDSDSIFERIKPTGGVIRKGQVLAIPSQHMLDTGLSLQAASGLRAVFRDDGVTKLSVGSLVNIYVATVRAAARILKVIRYLHNDSAHNTTKADEHDDVFSMADSIELERPQSDSGSDFSEYAVTLELLTNREWIELGSRVLLLEGGKQGSSGLEGYIGKVIEVAE